MRPASLRQIDAPAAFARLEHGSHEQIRAEEELILAGPGLRILRELIEERPQQRGACLVCGAHERAHIGADQLADADELREQRFHLRAVAPDLVRRALIQDRLASFVDVVRLRQTRAVQAHHRTEGAPLEPAQQQLVERGVADVAAVEAADIRRPPGDARHAHVHAGADLAAERFPRARNIAGPDKRAVPLAARPGAAHQAHGVFLALGAHAVRDHARVELRIEVAHAQGRAEVITVVAVIVHHVAGLGLVEPEQMNPVLHVILSEFIPHVSARVRIRHVGIDRLAVEEAQRDLHALLHAHKEIAVPHLLKVLAARVDRRPHGHHRLNPHGAQFPRHALRIREKLGVKAEISHARPVEEINDEHVQRHAALPVASRHLEHLLLSPVARLALPEPEAVFRHHGRQAGRPHI